MRQISTIYILIVFLCSCVTTKTALKDFNNAEYYNAASKFQKVIKEKNLNSKIEVKDITEIIEENLKE